MGLLGMVHVMLLATVLLGGVYYNIIPYQHAPLHLTQICPLYTS